jgi:hypothetical protein
MSDDRLSFTTIEIGGWWTGRCFEAIVAAPAALAACWEAGSRKVDGFDDAVLCRVIDLALAGRCPGGEA